MNKHSKGDEIERWDFFELSLTGPQDGNPYRDVRLSAQFKHKSRLVEPDGFYDGDGVYHVRFMPDTLGVWQYMTRSNCPELDGHTGEFICIEPSPENHGPVRVHNTYHFAYADGTPYFQVGTTCYAWVHQGDDLEEQTLATLRCAPFNKIRMCVFPKDYIYNRNEPEFLPFERTTMWGWDLRRFNPPFFHHFERRLGQLCELGIEADIILFHPYDRWGFATMGTEADDFYLRYVVSRLAAFRNVWWSMANEYDFMAEKSEADWDRFFRLVQTHDPYQHPRSIHNGARWYDHGKPWVTHASIQGHDVEKVTKWREHYQKPVVVDECRYEGNVGNQWGNITAEEMVRLFWEGTLRGGYVGHGETYLHPDDVLWWSKGGVLHGHSPERIAFFKRMMEEMCVQELVPTSSMSIVEGWHLYACLGKPDGRYILYFGTSQPGRVTLKLPDQRAHLVEIIDTWEMTVVPLEGSFSGEFEIELPGRPYIAVRIHAAK